MSVTDIKITTTKEKDQNYSGAPKEITKFYANGTLVAECEKGKDYFCTVKNGAPSTIRDKFRVYYKTKWNKKGLIEIVRTDMFTDKDFKDDKPDFRFGIQGKALTAKRVKELIENFIDRHLESTLDSNDVKW